MALRTNSLRPLVKHKHAEIASTLTTRGMSILGTGGLATVIRVSDEFAVKILADNQAADEEANILEALGTNATVVGFYGQLAGQTTSIGCKALLLELCQGSLHDAILELPGQRLENPASLTAQLNVAMMINCVAQLHSKGVIHQDIKPSNFLLGQDGTIKLCDFNLSRLASDAARISGGTVLYFSPSMLNSTDESYGADWWALGVTLYQVLHGLATWPFSSRSLRQLDQLEPSEQMAVVKKAILKGHIRYRPLCGIPRAAKVLIQGLLNPLPEKRWGLLQVLSADYPSDSAYSAVALRFPQLRSDMERLLALRRLCKEAPPPRALGVPMLNCYTGCTASPNTTDKKSPLASCRSLRALSSCLPQLPRSRKSVPPSAAEPNDVLQTDQRLPHPSTLRPRTAASASTTIGTADTCAAGASTSTSPTSPISSPTGSPAGRRTTTGSSLSGSATTTSPPLQACYTGNISPPSGWRRPRGNSVTIAAVATCARAVSMCKALLPPKSDAAARAAAVHAAALAPRALLTPDGRLAPAPRVPCQTRAHQLDMVAFQAVLSTLKRPPPPKPCMDAVNADSYEWQLARGCAGGQVQGVKVLEEMRVVFERRRQTVVGAGSAGGGSGGSKTAAQPSSTIAKPSGCSPPSCGGRRGTMSGPGAPRPHPAGTQLVPKSSGGLGRDVGGYSNPSGVQYPTNRISNGRPSNGNAKVPCGRGLMSAFEAAANALPSEKNVNGAASDASLGRVASLEAARGVPEAWRVGNIAAPRLGSGGPIRQHSVGVNDAALLALSTQKLDGAPAIVPVNDDRYCPSAASACPRRHDGLPRQRSRRTRTCGGRQRLYCAGAAGVPQGAEDEPYCRVLRQVKTCSGSGESKAAEDGVPNGVGRLFGAVGTNGAVPMAGAGAASDAPAMDYSVKRNVQAAAGLITAADCCSMHAGKSTSRRAASDRGLESAPQGIEHVEGQGEEERPSWGSGRAGRGVKHGSSGRTYRPDGEEPCGRDEFHEASGSGGNPAKRVALCIRRHTSVATTSRCGAPAPVPVAGRAAAHSEAADDGVPSPVMEVVARTWLGEEPLG